MAAEHNSDIVDDGKPWPMPAMNFCDDDLYIYDEKTREIVKHIGCKMHYYDSYKSGRTPLPTGQRAVIGMQARHMNLRSKAP